MTVNLVNGPGKESQVAEGEDLPAVGVAGHHQIKTGSGKLGLAGRLVINGQPHPSRRQIGGKLYCFMHQDDFPSQPGRL